MTKRHRHVHGIRNYFGELDAAAVVDWLNSKAKLADDPVETLLNLNTGLPFDTSPHDISSYLSKIVRRSKISVAPVLVTAGPNKWDVDWRLVGRMDARQGLALIRLLHLADKGLIERIRKCANTGCSKWFYARFQHQHFHSQKCQLETFRSDAEWKAKRREYMKNLRQAKKMQEKQWARGRRRK